MKVTKKSASPNRPRNPRFLRIAVREGYWKVSGKKVPIPDDWPIHWQRGMGNNVTAARLFLQGCSSKDLLYLAEQGAKTRQRISQMVKKGCDYLIKCGLVYPVLDTKGKK